MTKKEILAGILSGTIKKEDLKRPVCPVGTLNGDATIRTFTLIGQQDFKPDELEVFDLPGVFMIDDL